MLQSNFLLLATRAIGMGSVAMAGSDPAAFIATSALVVSGATAFLAVRVAWKKEGTVCT